MIKIISSFKLSNVFTNATYFCKTLDNISVATVHKDYDNFDNFWLGTSYLGPLYQAYSDKDVLIKQIYQNLKLIGFEIVDDETFNKMKLLL